MTLFDHYQEMMQEGLEEGRAEGRAELLCQLVQEGLISREIAAEKLHVSSETIEKIMLEKAGSADNPAADV